MNIKFISSAGYQLWASEGVITRYIYVGICSPDMAAHEYGDMFVRAEELGILGVQAQLDNLVPVMSASIEDLVPQMGAEGELKPKVTASLPPRVCEDEE